MIKLQDLVRCADFEEQLGTRLASCRKSQEAAGHSYFLQNFGPQRIPTERGQHLVKFGMQSFAIRLLWFVRGRKCIYPRLALFGLFSMLPDSIAEQFMA